MNREIKFRAWDKARERLIYLDLSGVFYSENVGEAKLIFGDNFYDIFQEECEIDVDLMQYTGLKDKRGTEIYESDLLRSYEGIIWFVQWDSERAEFELSWKGGPQPEYFRHGMHIVRDTRCEVVGNIYEQSGE